MCAQAVVDTVPENPYQEELLRFDFQHVTNAAAGEAYNVIETGLVMPPDIRDFGWGWQIFAVTIRPAYNPSGNQKPFTHADAYCNFQLATGVRTTGVDEDSDDYNGVLAGCAVRLDLLTSGANSHVWPIGMDILRPFDYFGSALTFLSYSSNTIGFNSAALTVTVHYCFTPMTGQSMLSYLINSGQL